VKDRPAYLPLYVRDFLTDPNVLAMTWTQKAVYLRMLMLSWEAGPLPASDAMVARMIEQESLEPDVAAVRAMAWNADAAGNSFNPRLEHERQRWRTLHEDLSKSGKEGNRRRWNRSPGDPGAIAGASPGDRNTQAQAQAQEEDKSADRPAEAGAPPPAAPAPTARKGTKRTPFEGTPILAEYPDLDTPEVREACGAYCEARRSRHGHWTPQGMRLAVRKFQALGPVALRRAFEQATESPWMTIKTPDELGHRAGGITMPTARERQAAPSSGDLAWCREALRDKNDVVKEEARRLLREWGVSEAEVLRGQP